MNIKTCAMETDILTKVLLILIVLHLVVGFGYMIYRLSPRKGEKNKQDTEDPKNKIS